eukprot:9619134-Ditylum_brightwellii.AAC.1
MDVLGHTTMKNAAKCDTVSKPHSAAAALYCASNALDCDGVWQRTPFKFIGLLLTPLLAERESQLDLVGALMCILNLACELPRLTRASPANWATSNCWPARNECTSSMDLRLSKTTR